MAICCNEGQGETIFLALPDRKIRYKGQLTQTGEREGEWHLTCLYECIIEIDREITGYNDGDEAPVEILEQEFYDYAIPLALWRSQ